MNQLLQDRSPQAAEKRWIKERDDLKEDFISAGQLHLDDNGNYHFHSDEMSRAFAAQQDDIDVKYLTSRVRAIRDKTLRISFARRDGKAVFGQLQFLAGQLDSRHATWSPLYWNDCYAAYKIVSKVSLFECLYQVKRQNDVNQPDVLQWLFNLPPRQ